MAATATVVSIVWWTLTVVALHVVSDTAYDPVAQPISELVDGPYGSWLNVAFLVLGLGGFALAHRIRRALPRAAPAATVLAVCAGLWMLAGVFQAGPREPENILHNVVAGLSLVLVFPTMLLFAARAGAHRGWRRFARATRIWAAVAGGALLLAPVLGVDGLGIVQRAFITVWLAWLLTTTVRLRAAPTRVG